MISKEDLNERVNYLLQFSNFPKFVKLDISKDYPKLADYVKNPIPLHFKCSNLTSRKVAKSIALSLAIDFIVEKRAKHPPYYLYKSSFIEICRDAYFRNNFEELTKFKEGSFIIFDGIDEINSSQEMVFISTFLTPMLIKQSPLILISSGNLTEEVFKKYNANSFGSLFFDVYEMSF